MKSKFCTSLFSLMIFCLFTLYGQANNDGLANYVERLKASKASGGSETAFMSVGSDFMYAQEYFEAKNYASAAYDFAKIVRNDPNHAYANYQLAIALIRQQDAGKAKDAQQYLEQAFKLEPSLRERFALDVPQAEQPTAKLPQQEELEDYLEALKASKAGGGKLTAMGTAGYDALYGYEYYESGNYSGAETYFRMALGTEPANPYINYLMALALTQQGKEKAAHPYLAKAVAGDTRLEKQYMKEQEAIKARQQQQSLASAEPVSGPTANAETKAPAPTPAKPAIPVSGGKLVYGAYTCHETVWNGPNTVPAYRHIYKGYFELNPNGTYRWLDNGGTGRYSYNKTTGTITWLSGPLKNKAPMASKYKPGNTVAQVSLNFTKDYGWECGCDLK